MSLQASWNAMLGAVGVAKRFHDTKKRMSEAETERQKRITAGRDAPASVEAEMSSNEQEERNRQPSPGLMTGSVEERLNARLNAPDVMSSRRQAMTNQEAAQRAEQHIQESDTSQNNVGSVVQAMRSRSQRDKYKRQRELRKRREGKVKPNGTAETT